MTWAQSDLLYCIATATCAAALGQGRQKRSGLPGFAQTIKL